MRNRYDVVGIGATVFDTLMVVPRFPAEDTKLEASRTQFAGGGPCATALAAMCRLGASAQYVGEVGDDLYGAFMLEDFRRRGVGVEHVGVVAGAQSFHSVVLLNAEAATRTCVWNRGNVPPLSPEKLPTEEIRAAKFLHLDGHQLEAAISAAKLARAAAVPVSLDAGGAYPGIERLLPWVDVLIPSEEFVRKLTGEADPEAGARRLHREYRPAVLIVTQGVRGGFGWDGEALWRYPAFPVAAVDTNGAGDVFHGAFVAARTRGLDVKESARFASAASALKCTRVGARDGVPSWDEAMKLAFGGER